MGVRFNADEAFEMAERIEEKGEAFYRKAADLQADQKNKTFLLKLADMEKSHKATFAAMRAKLSGETKESTAYDPYMEAALYLQSMADSHGGEGSQVAVDHLTGKESLETIIQIAIGLEHRSIIFYLGLRDMVPANLGKDKIDVIIAEEKSHVVTLATELKAVKKG